MITQSPYPPISLTGETITERLFRGLTPRDRVVVIDGPSGAELTAGQVIDRIKALAGGLAARGHGAGAVVAIMAPNCPDYVVAFHAPLWAGGTVTTINPTYTAPEVAHQLADSGASLLITIPAFLDTAKAAAQGTQVREIVVIGGADGQPSLTDLEAGPLPAQVPVDVTAHVAVLPYSSGTTGLPKGVMLSHRNLVANVDQALILLRPDPGEWTVAFLPFFHIYGQTVLMNLYLAAGGGIITMPRFDLEQFLTLAARHRTPTLFSAPPVAIALAKHPMVANFDLSGVERIFSAAAPLSAEVADAVGTRLNCQAVQGYGMTELAPISHAIPRGAVRAGSVGVCAPMTDCRVVDPATGQDAPEGELWVRGPQVMLGYHARPDATAATLVDGWLRTGDLARFDADGYLFILDRLKELIKVKGFQVAPAEVEAALLTHPAIADAAVRGIPDDDAGEVPVAYVVRAKGSGITEGEIGAFLAERLAPYKRPKRVTFLDAIPKSASGKILRRLLPV